MAQEQISARDIKGIVVPLPTPFKLDGELDDQLACEIADFEIAAGVNALFLLGSFGQGPVMRLDQRKKMAETVMRHVDGRVPVIIHVGTADVFSTVELGLHAKTTGCAAVAIVGPYYYSDHNEYEIIEHFKEAGEKIGMSVLIYNNPEYSGYDMSPALMRRLKDEAPGIFGAKLSTNSFETALRYLAEMPPDFSLFGLASSFMPAALYGMRGSIVPSQSSYPELPVAMWRAMQSGDLDAALKIQMRINTLSRTVSQLSKTYGRAAQCEALRMRGFKIQRFPRWKTKEMSAKDRQLLRDAMMQAGVPVAELVTG
jgi:dihydrodipicolinate synthase/N-acetylneuraminate lyase